MADQDEIQKEETGDLAGFHRHRHVVDDYLVAIALDQFLDLDCIGQGLSPSTASTISPGFSAALSVSGRASIR